MVVLIDDDFVKTGHKWKCYDVQAPPLSNVHIRVVSKGDPWDRLGSLIVGRVELCRFITPFDGSMEFTKDIPAELRLYASQVCGVITTFVGGWHYFAEGTPSEAVYDVKPVFALEVMRPERRRIEKTLASPVDVKKVALFLTGHLYEEGARGRTFKIILNDEVVATLKRDAGWRPGCGPVPGQPIIIDAERSGVSRVAVESPDCGRYWIVSLALACKLSVSPLSLLGGLAPVGVVLGTIGLSEASKARR